MAKADAIEIDKRIRAVQQWILLDYSSADIVAQCIAQWGVGERQARRYVEQAHVQFQEVAAQDLASRLNFHKQRRMKLLRDMDPNFKKQPGGVAVALSVLQDIAKLEGLYTNKIDITTKGETINGIDYSKLSTETLKELNAAIAAEDRTGESES